MEAFNLAEYLETRKQWVEQALSEAVPLAYPDKLYESMRYSLFAGGKRLRPILCLASCELAGGTMNMAMPTACALEMIHTMSLIHDDLPAMDDDDYRRGQLTNHKVYGDAIAILAGDALLAYAFGYIGQQTPTSVDPSQVVSVITRLAMATSAKGLVGGQVVDLESEGKAIDLDTLHYIHTHKTGALLEISVVSGALLAGAESDLIDRLTKFAHDIGLAFQIVDDILDVTATSEQLGKTAGKDVTAEKATFPSLLGLEASQQRANELIQSAQEQLKPYGEQAIPLSALADYITRRTN